MIKSIHVFICFLLLNYSMLFAIEKNIGYSMDIIDEKIQVAANAAITELEQNMPYLNCCGRGGSWSRDNTHIIHEFFAFQIRKILTKEEGINFIVQFANKFLSNLYKEKKLENYLKNHSFNYENLEINIVVYDDLGYEVWHPKIQRFYLHKGKLTWSTYSPSEEFFYKIESEETGAYEEMAKQLGVWEELPEPPTF